jgi:hypothetical protein
MRTVNEAAELLEAVKDSDALIAITTLFSGMYVIAIPGQRVSFRDPMVRERPEAFVPVLAQHVDPAMAVRCLSPLDVQDKRPGAPPWATRRLVWPGQLLSHDDELVREHPDHFEEEPQ